MEYLGSKYKTYALDFWGFGDSAKQGASFTVVEYVEMVNQFMERMVVGARSCYGALDGRDGLAEPGADVPEACLTGCDCRLAGCGFWP
jgi:hypothetical protein